MAKWWPFGRKKAEAPRPEPTPRPGPAPEPGEAPPKRRGLFGRMADKIRRKPKEAPPPAAPPAAPPTPPAPPTAPLAPAEEAPPEEAGAPPAAPPKERVYPSFLHVEASGLWIISDTEWEGTMSGTLHGSDVKVFIDAMEAEGGPDYEIAIPLIGDAYGIPGGLINVGASRIDSVIY